ncbi:hypothetical protein VHA01S_030_00330 [Vibrio halioticoli NBRC 102217]|uniref:Transposase n=1 Tax=Vibrio halioticoli NBRC 102217 TaxID=1219072 RepID=V5FE78_9VIBR|nr:hypothetical protein [Vibrio halioticoli]GAD89958.1 hypothetical protein VHA01S_030_00330 [Vibrio halioticoli NBRC 102217]
MDADQYKHLSKPTKKLESLKAYKDGLFNLRFSGYSYDSLSKWLKNNGLEVSEHTVRRFFSKFASDYESYKTEGIR